MDGRVDAIHITDRAGGSMTALERARLQAGVGIEGDRYASERGTWSDHPAGNRELTLVAGEVLDELGLEPGSTRRNITVRGIDVNSLVGREFTIGEVRCRGERLCEPCSTLEGSIGRPILRELAHRAGLRASILSDGEIGVGDPVRPA